MNKRRPGVTSGVDKSIIHFMLTMETLEKSCCGDTVGRPVEILSKFYTLVLEIIFPRLVETNNRNNIRVESRVKFLERIIVRTIKD